MSPVVTIKVARNRPENRGIALDNANLSGILSDTGNRTFWIKPVGLPGTLPTGTETYNTDPQRVDFSVRPVSVQLRDVFLAYRVGDLRLMYVGECDSEMRQATADEIALNPNRGRWPWYFEAKNLTPEYGSVWLQHDLRPVRLVEEFNALNPGATARLNGLMYGRDRLRVARTFAEFIIRRVMALPQVESDPA
ncbi:MAG: hypothetical protein C0467_15835 [Planctomycetaceae bacterium]|nr:hypothetical protein [Planctomycetaceae bacterium]